MNPHVAVIIPARVMVKPVVNVLIIRQPALMKGRRVKSKPVKMVYGALLQLVAAIIPVTVQRPIAVFVSMAV